VIRKQVNSSVGTTHRWAGILLLGLCLLTACRPSPHLSSTEPIKLASYDWPGSFWIEVAADKGWFAEAGLNVKRIDVDTKYFQSLNDVDAGKIDGMGFSQFDLVRHVASGNDLVGVAAIDYSEGAEALVAIPGIHSLRDLKGKKLALPRGTYLEYLLSVVAERENFNLSEVTLVDRPTLESVADFKDGKVDAVFVWEPYVSEAVQAGGHSVFSTTDFPGLTYSVLTFRHDFINARPQDVAALIRVWHRAERFVHEHMDETCLLVSRRLEENLPEVQQLTREVHVLDLPDNGRAFSYAAGFESLHGSWRRMNDFMLEHGLVNSRVDGSPHLDSRFVRALE
jgi:NitT/TauT family transport system substrate-binding protein